MSHQSYTTLTALQREKNKISPPPRHCFLPFIKPECHCNNDLVDFNCESLAFIPNINSLSNNIYLKHGTKYNIGITNESNFNANADIFIDNQHIGSFRIPKNADNIQIERPVDVNRSFIFMSKNSDIAQLAGVNQISNRHLGIINIHLRPEDKSYHTTYNTNNNTARNQGLSCEVDGISHTKIAKKDENMTLPGCTVLGKPTFQSFKLSDYMHTKGLHKYSYKLVIGNPTTNTKLYINNIERYMPCKHNNVS